MARPEQVRLTITSRSGSPTSTATVNYVAVFNNADVNGNRRYRETIQLFGQDPPPGPAGDVSLFTFPPATVRPNGQQRVPRRRSAQVPNNVLEEDRGGDEDEIYARVCLELLGAQNPPVLCSTSGTISQAQPEEPEI